MKITKTKEKRFEPISVTLVFETQDEIDNFCEDLEEALMELVRSNKNLTELLNILNSETSVKARKPKPIQKKN